MLLGRERLFGFFRVGGRGGEVLGCSVTTMVLAGFFSVQ